MVALTVLYWRQTRPVRLGGGAATGTSGTPGGAGPVGPVDPMLAAALRPPPAPFVTRDDLGLA